MFLLLLLLSYTIYKITSPNANNIVKVAAADGVQFITPYTSRGWWWWCWYIAYKPHTTNIERPDGERI